MNKVYRTVFNEKTNTWVAVAETAKAHGKSGRSGGVVAAVADGMLLNKKMLAVSAAVAAAMAAQPAMADNARIENGSASWTIAISPSDSTAANGGAKATGEYSTAVGYEASAGHQLGVAIGYKAETRGNYSLALGPLAKAGTSGSWGTAIGYNADAGGSGSPLAVGTMSKTLGDSPIAIGDWAISEGDGAVAIGGKRSGGHSPGQSTYAKGNQTVALGYLAQATQEKALALGANADASLANAVALGAGSLTNQDATQETQATVGGITYGAAAGQPAAFAGAANVQAGSQVSMGAAGSERQIKHVAPGAITAASTDAINGSQLHATQAVIDNLASTTASHLGGTVSVGADGRLTAPAYNVAGNTYNNVGAALGALDGAIKKNKTHYYSVNSSEQAAGSNYDNDGATGTNALAAGVNAKATGQYSTAVGYAASAGHQLGVAIGYEAETRGDYSLALGALAKAGTSGSWGTAIGYSAEAGGSSSPLAIGTYSKTISGVSPIAIGDWATGEGNGAVAIGSNAGGQHLPGRATYAKGDHTVALGSLAQATQEKALALGANANAAQRNSIAIGNEAEVENSPANSSNSSIAIGDKAKAQGDLALAIGPGATVSGESAAGGIAIGSAATSKNGGMAVGSGANAGNGTPMIPGLPVRLNNNVALGDSALVKDDTNFRVALGSFSIAGESDLTAAPYKPTANANVAGIAGSGVELGEVSVGGDNTAGMGKILYRRVTNVAAGAADTDAVNVSQLKAAQAAATSKVAAGNGISVTPTVDANTGSTTYTVAADTTALNVGDGNNGNPAGKVIAPTGADANKLATAGDIANAINNSGFNIDAGGNNVVGSHTATTAKPGSTLTLKAGDGLTVEQELDGQGNQSYTYALNAQTVVQNAQTPVVYTKADGTKVYKRPDGKFYDAPTGGNEVAAGDVIASMQNAAGNTTTPTTLANVMSNLADAAAATTNPANNDRAALTANNKGNNAATVKDVLNAGFTVQGNGTNKDFVTHGDTINFVNGQGTVAKVNTTNGVTEVKFDTPMTYVDDTTGASTNTPSNKVNLVGGTAGSPVTLGNVAPGTLSATSTEAVNGSQLHATNQNVAKGINFGGTTGSNNYQLGDTIRVKGDSNITSTTENGGVQLGLNQNLNVTSVTATDAAGNKTVTNGGGVTITPAGGGNPVSLTTGGLNNGGNKITNVAPGEISATSTDAVNGSQLHNAINNSVGNVAGAVENLQNRMGKLQDDSEAGTASALAAAGLPQAYLPGKSMIAVSGSTYRGQQGYAVGISAISDSGNWIVKGTATGNSRGHFGATIGAGYQW